MSGYDEADDLLRGDAMYESQVEREVMNLMARQEAQRRVREREEMVRQGRARLRPGGDFVFDEPEVIPSLWGEGDRVLWAAGEGLMIAGGQGLGKTTIAQQLVLARLGLRAPSFLGLPVAPGDGQVLYLAMDRPRQAARSLRRMVTANQRDLMNERLVVWPGPLPVSVTSSAQALADWVQDECPGVDTLVVDSVKDLAPGLSSDEVGAAINMAWQEVIARGIEMVALHHERKATSGTSSRGSSLDDVYGSTWLTAGLGSVVQVIGKRGEPQVTLHHLKQPAEEVGPLTVEHDHFTGTTTAASVLTVEDHLVQCALRGETQTVAQVTVAVGMTMDKVRRRIRALVRDGKVVEVEPERNTPTGKVGATYMWRVGV